MAQLQISDDEFNRLLTLRDNLIESVQESATNHSAYMAGIFQEMLKIVTRQISKVQAARHRVMLADHNKTIKALRQGSQLQ